MELLSRPVPGPRAEGRRGGWHNPGTTPAHRSGAIQTSTTESLLPTWGPQVHAYPSQGLCSHVIRTGWHAGGLHSTYDQHCASVGGFKVPREGLIVGDHSLRVIYHEQNVPVLGVLRYIGRHGVGHLGA